MNTIEKQVIDFQELSGDEQLARNNRMFKNKTLRYDLETRQLFWPQEVNQNIQNN